MMSAMFSIHENETRLIKCRGDNNDITKPYIVKYNNKYME